MPDDAPGDPAGDPFAALGPLFGDMARMLAGQGPLSWDVARQLASVSATEGRPETNVDPLDRIRLEEFARVAERHVEDATGMEVSRGGRGVTIVTVTRSGWASTFLDDHREILSALATSLGSGAAMVPAEPGVGPDPSSGAGFEQFLAGIGQLFGPVLLGMQVGSMAGHLARRVLGTYDLPMPRPGDRLVFIPSNIAAFAKTWSLPLDSVRMRVLLAELARHAVLRRPHVSAWVADRLRCHAGSYRVDPSAFEDRLGQLDPTDPSSFQALLSDPQVLLGAVQTPAQVGLASELRTFAAVLEGYVDHVLAAIGPRVLGTDLMLEEAGRRHRIEVSSGDRYAEKLLGLSLDQAVVGEGAEFIAGVVERAGPSGLARLWEREETLVTPNELAAPGLWLARLEFIDS